MKKTMFLLLLGACHGRESADTDVPDTEDTPQDTDTDGPPEGSAGHSALSATSGGGTGETDAHGFVLTIGDPITASNEQHTLTLGIGTQITAPGETP